MNSSVVFRPWGSYFDVLNILRDRVPARYPVQIRWTLFKVQQAGDCGFSARKNKRKFIIRLDRRLTEGERIMALLHEWAHAIAWGFESDETFHGPEWAVCYARVCRAVLDNS